MKKLEHDLKQGKDSLFTIFEDLEYGEIEELILLNGDIEEEEDANLWGELDKRMDVGELKFPTLKKLHLINWFDWDERFANTFHNMNIWFPNLETLIIEKFENPLDLTDLHSFRNIKIIKFIDCKIKLYFDHIDDYYQPIPHELAEIYSTDKWGKPSFQKLEKIDYFSITDENSIKMLKNIKFIGHLGISKCHDIDNLIKYLEKIKINKLILGIIERPPDWVTINTKDINKLLSLGIKKIIVFGTIKLEDGSNFVGEKEFTK